MASASRLDKRKLEQMIRSQPSKTDAWLRGVALTMEGNIKQSMLDSPASGATYSRGEGRTHTASSPGNAPRPDMGALINSIRMEKVGRLHYEIRDGVEYGIALEDGTTRIAARPFMRPEFERQRLNLANDAKKHLFS
ncbi:MAG: hypothetical protein AAF787_00235 [Chloroflexota bacterium]